MGKKTPDTPDVEGAAATEAAASREAARDANYANRPDQYNSLGSNTWQQESVRDPATGEMTTRWSQRQNLSPAMQQLFDNQMNRNLGLTGAAASMNDRIVNDMSQPFDWDQFGSPVDTPTPSGVIGGNAVATTGSGEFVGSTGQNVGGGINPTIDGSNAGFSASTGQDIGSNVNPTSSGVGFNAGLGQDIGAQLDPTMSNDVFSWDSQNRARAEEAAYAKATNRLDPRFQQGRAELERQMANRGLRAGDSAFDSSFGNFGRSQNDAYENAHLSSVEQGRIEDQQSYGQAYGAYQANRQAEQARFEQARRVAENKRQADQQRWDQEYGDFTATLDSEGQAYDQSLSSAENKRAADQQRFDQARQEYEAGESGRNLAFEQQIAAGVNERQADQQRYDQVSGDWDTNRATEQQRFDQNLAAGKNNREADQQAFDNEFNAQERQNALRSGNMAEYIAKRRAALDEQTALYGATDVADMTNTYGG